MFPLITRDDVFRIETSRLWLRWPKAGDGAALRAFASCAEVALMTASIPHPYPAGEEQRAIAAIRAGNRRGDRLELLIERKNPQRDVIGTVLVRAEQERDPYLGYALHPDHWGQGGNQASCHVLEKLGFALQGERTHFSALRNAAQRLADYGLTRTAYHARFGGALYPLHWTVPYNSHEWIGAA